jgi:hypothetical protein
MSLEPFSLLINAQNDLLFFLSPELLMISTAFLVEFPSRFPTKFNHA